MKLLIVRHAEPDYSIDSLTEKGWREAEYLSESDGKASDGNEQQPWKMRQCSGRWRGVRGQQHASQAYKWYKKPKD